MNLKPATHVNYSKYTALRITNTSKESMLSLESRDLFTLDK